MNRTDLLDSVGRALRDAFPADQVGQERESCPSSDFVLRKPCYAAFFALAPVDRPLDEVCARAQAEIAGLQGSSDEAWPRDLELVLLVQADLPPDPAAVREILDDKRICRKFVLFLDGRPVSHTLEALPFWPPGKKLKGPSTFIGAGVREAISGFDVTLVSDLSRYAPGVERVVDNIRSGAYELESHGRPAPAVGPTVPPRVKEARLTSIEISDFRGITCLGREKMPLSGDVVVIYGPNGVGKTSIAQALEWTVTGRIDRVEKARASSGSGGPDPIVNVFAEGRGARVKCWFANRDAIERTKQGRSTERTVGTRKVADDRAVIDHVVGTRALAGTGRLRLERLRDLFRGSHLLSQHNMRDFLEAADPKERFDILTNMIGAEEFVRFRQKVEAVRKKLDSSRKGLHEDVESLREELKAIAGKITTLQAELKGHCAAAPEEVSWQTLAKDVLAGLRTSGCEIDEATIRNLQSLTSLDHAETLLALSGPAIDRGATSTADALAHLSGIEQRIPGHEQMRQEERALNTELGKTREAAERELAALRKLEEDQRRHKALLAHASAESRRASRQYANLNWLAANMSRLRSTQDALHRIASSLADLRSQVEKLETNLEGRQREHAEMQNRLAQARTSIATAEEQRSAIAALLQRSEEAQARQEEVRRLSQAETSARDEIDRLQKSKAAIAERLRIATRTLKEAQRKYDDIAKRHDVLSSFLAKLAALVEAPECPLCGRLFDNIEEARSAIAEHISSIPADMRALATEVEEAKKRVDTVEADVCAAEDGIRTAELRLTGMEQDRQAATIAVQEFVEACQRVQPSSNARSVAEWQRALKVALEGCSTEPLRANHDALRKTMQELETEISRQQQRLLQLRRKVERIERERTQLASSLAGLEAEVAERGFDTGTIPDHETVADLAQTAHAHAEEVAKNVAVQQAKTDNLERTVISARENVEKLNRDIVAHEAQLQRYRGLAGQFAAECRRFGIETEKNIVQDVQAAKRRASDDLAKLEHLTALCERLRYSITSQRVQHELDDLRQQEAQLRKRVVAGAEEEARLQQWSNRLCGLEAEATRQQAAVVGEHLEVLQPAIQLIYQRLSPHPLFPRLIVDVDATEHALRIEAVPEATTEYRGKLRVAPPMFFSDAQMNVLALAVFLAGALRQRWSALRTVTIDDPVQQMDEMNVCAFLDLIRGLSGPRQFIVFTCSRDFYLLALDKLSCLNKSKPGSFLGYRLQGIPPAELQVFCDAS